MAVARIKSRYFNLIQSLNNCIVKFKMLYSRFEANKSRREVIKRKGKKVVNRQIMRSIKKYSKKRFGTRVYWPYLALYTEIRGQFMEGWLPDDYFRYILVPQISSAAAVGISEYKTFDYQIFGDFALKPLFVFISGMFLNAEFDAVAEEKVKKTLQEYDDTIVVKEDRGIQGAQVLIIHSSEFKTETLLPGRSYVIQPYVKQHKAMSDLYSDSVNTLRVATFIANDGSVLVKFVILRFGIDGSKVDNISAGGQYIYFDAEGKPSKSAYSKMGFDVGERHKNSGYRFADLKIPMFQEVLKACISAHKKYPYDRLVGWDVCISESGKPLLLEWNTNPGFRTFESVFGPFFPDDDIV
jgi:hypothetical protein